MSCADMKLADRVHGLLAEPDAAALREHLSGCADCRQAVGRLEDERAVLAAAARELVQERAARPARRSARRFWRRLTVAASILICAGALTVLLGRPEPAAVKREVPGPSRQPATVPAFQTADAREREELLRSAQTSGTRLPTAFLLDCLEQDRMIAVLAVERLVAQEAVDAVPEIVRRMVEQPRAYYNPDTLELLKRLDPAGAVVQLRARLAHPQGPGKGALLWMLGELKAVDAAGEIRPFAGDADAETRRCAAFALGNMASPEDIPALVRLTEDASSDVRVVAMESLGRRRAPEAVAALIARLEDSRESVRITAAHALGGMGEAGRAARTVLVRRLREEPVAIVRGALVGALGRVGLPEDWPEVARLLDEEEPSVRAYTLQALEQLGDPAALPEIRKRLDSLFRDRTNQLQTTTAEVIASLAGREGAAALGGWLDDPRLEIRIAAAERLCLLGSTAGVPVLLRESRDLEVLNALAAPDAWRALRERSSTVAETKTLPVSEFLEELARQAGLGVDLTAVPHLRDAQYGGGSGTLHANLVSLCRVLQVQPVLEGRRLRMLSDADAKTYWEAWWRSR